jgi:hypothetical protein
MTDQWSEQWREDHQGLWQPHRSGLDGWITNILLQNGTQGHGAKPSHSIAAVRYLSQPCTSMETAQICKNSRVVQNLETRRTIAKLHARSWYFQIVRLQDLNIWTHHDIQNLRSLAYRILHRDLTLRKPIVYTSASYEICVKLSWFAKITSPGEILSITVERQLKSNPWKPFRELHVRLVRRDERGALETGLWNDFSL